MIKAIGKRNLSLTNKKNRFEDNPKKTILLFMAVFTIILLIGIDRAIGYFEGGKGIKNPLLKQGEKRYIMLREHNPNTGGIIYPNREYLQLSESLEFEGFPFYLDSNGFVKPSKIYEKSDLNIVFLGGSTTECMYVYQDSRFPYLVGRYLEEKMKLKINSYNSGVAGNNTLHSLNILLNKIVPLKPDMVILMHNINDLSILLYEKTYWNDNLHKASLVDREKEPDFIHKTVKSIKDNFIPNIYAKLTSITDISKIVQKITGIDNSDEFASARGKRIDIDREFILKSFTNNLQSFIDICRVYGIKPILMTQQNRFSKTPDKYTIKTMKKIEVDFGITYSEYKNIYDDINEATREVGKKNGILVIDLATKVPHDKKYFYDLVHFNNYGSKKAAEIISQELFSSMIN